MKCHRRDSYQTEIRDTLYYERDVVVLVERHMVVRMRTVLVLTLVLACAGGARAGPGPYTEGASRPGGRRYTFYRSMGPARGWGSPPTGEARRVFGGVSAQLNAYPAACVLLDRYWTVRCSASVVAPRWALTAAHCVSPHIAYIKYNTRQPALPEGDLATVHYLYRHPGFKVVQEDEGRGMDVTLLHHDVGLVRTRRDMQLAEQPQLEMLRSLRLYNPIELRNEEVQVLGFGRTERLSQGEEMFQVKLRLVNCERGAWFHCVCGVANPAPQGEPRGVCSGDSGGPVLFRGTQVGVTSMGPLECSSMLADPPEGATSVFTSLYNYAELVNATIFDTEAALRMKLISAGERRRLSSCAALLAGAALAAPLR